MEAEEKARVDRVRRAPWILALLIALSACRKPSAPVAPAGAIAVSESPALASVQAAGLAMEEIRRLAQEGALAGFGDYRPEGKTPPRLTVLFVHVLADEDASGVRSAPGKVEVGVEVELASEGSEPARRESAQSAERVDPAEGLPPALRRALTGAARKGAEVLSLSWKEERKTNPELVRDLQAEDPRIRDYAIRVLADRKNPAVVPALIERLHDSDEDVVERTVGALAEIRDPRAVDPLIDLSQHRDPPIVAQLARIIGDIGGHEAEAYLVTLSAGHPEPSVRQAAQAALAEMRLHPGGTRRRE